MNRNAAAGPYPATRQININLTSDGSSLTVQPHSAKVKNGGTLQFRVGTGIASFEVTMKDSKRTPFASGKPNTSGGKSGKDEAVAGNANGGDSDAKNTYSYSVSCTKEDGTKVDVDPDIIVGPPT